MPVSPDLSRQLLNSWKATQEGRGLQTLLDETRQGVKDGALDEPLPRSMDIPFS